MSWAKPQEEDAGSHNRAMRSVNTAELILREPPELKFCVQGLFTRPSLNLLAGDPGHKKSLLATDLALCVAMGKPWLGLPVVQQPVLLVEEESGLLRLWKRLNSAFNAHGGTLDTPFNFITMGFFDFRDVKDAEDLIDHAHRTAAGLIVIDALANVMVGGDENSVISIQPVFRNLRLVARDTGAAIVIVHHNNKSGIFRGSTSISAGVDHHLSVYSPSGQDLIRLKTVKSHDVESVLIHAKAHFTANSFHLTATDEKLEDRATLHSSSLDIFKALGSLGTATTQQLLFRVKSSSPSSIRKVIYELMVGGYINRVDDGSRGKIASYRLSDTGRTYLSRISNVS